MSEYNDVLFHYTKLSTAIDYILKNKQLRFSTISNTNDPYERYPLIFSYSKRSKEEKLNDETAVEKCIWLSEHIKEGIQMLCLTKDLSSDNELGKKIYNFGRGFSKPRMWAQYAENFNGICLGINKQRLIEAVEKKYKEMDLVYDDILYSTEEKYVWNVMHATTITEKDSVLSNEELLFSMLDKYKPLYFFTKHSDWQEEKEFRIIIRDRNLEDNYIDIDGVLDYIIIGTEVEQDNINILYEEIEQFDKKPELFRIEFWDGYYQLVSAVIY